MERESLKEINEELRCSQAQQHQLSQAGTAQNNELLQYNNKVERAPLPVSKNNKRYLIYTPNVILNVIQRTRTCLLNMS